MALPLPPSCRPPPCKRIVTRNCWPPLQRAVTHWRGAARVPVAPPAPPARPEQRPPVAARPYAASPPAGGHPGACVLLAAAMGGPWTGAHLLTLPTPPALPLDGLGGVASASAGSPLGPRVSAPLLGGPPDQQVRTSWPPACVPWCLPLPGLLILSLLPSLPPSFTSHVQLISPAAVLTDSASPLALPPVAPPPLWRRCRRRLALTPRAPRGRTTRASR